MSVTGGVRQPDGEYTVDGIICSAGGAQLHDGYSEVSRFLVIPDDYAEMPEQVVAVGPDQLCVPAIRLDTYMG